MPGALPYSKCLREAKAFCDGMKASADGDLKATNPHSDVGDTVAAAAWDAGWDQHDNLTGKDGACSGCGFPVAAAAPGVDDCA